MSAESSDARACGAIKRAFEALPNTMSVECTLFAKTLVFQAVDEGWIRLDEALSRYRLGIDDYRTWQEAMMR